MPLTTREPRNGGVNTSLSVATSGERAGQLDDGGVGVAGALGQLAAGRHAAEVGVPLAAALHRHQRVERRQPLERVAAVEQAALVDLAQVALDVAAGERGAAEQHRDLAEAERVQLLEVLAHDQRRLHEQAAHAEGVGVDLLDLGDHLADRHLDAEVVDLVAVVRADDVDEVLADVVDVALHRGDDELALRRRAVDALHVRLEVGDRRLHRLRRLQHERQLHLPGAEQLADDLHPVEQHVVDDVEGRHARRPSPRRDRR